MVTAGEWFAVGFMVLMAITGTVCFVCADAYSPNTTGRHQRNLWGALSWAAMLAMGAIKF